MEIQNVIPLNKDFTSNLIHQSHSIMNQRLTLEAFSQLAGNLSGYPFVKIVVDRKLNNIYFINHAIYPFHADFIAERLMGITIDQLNADLDKYNHSFYFEDNRRFLLGLVSLNRRNDKRFFLMETVEVDNMNAVMIQSFFETTKQFLDPSIPFYFKPANHTQETLIESIDKNILPRIYNHELFATANFIALHAGVSKGRLRAFRNEEEYKKSKHTLEWFDIIVMPRVPDDIPRVSGIINANHTTPLSHTNVLASGWQIPNAIQIGIFEKIDSENLNNQWVNYLVNMNDSQIQLEKIEKPSDITQKPAWTVHTIRIESPEIINTPIKQLSELRMTDRFRYGTKAANIGEMHHIVNNGSERLLGFYKIKRPPRPNLLNHLTNFLNVPESTELSVLHKEAWEFVRDKIDVPNGIAIPFSIQQQTLEGSAQIQQCIGKLKMALELNSREIDAICIQLQRMIREVRIPDKVRDYIDAEIANHLGGVSTFVVRSSSNAEDLDGFSAAGIYESVIHVHTSDDLFRAIKDVWASLTSPRSIRLMHQYGISLDDCYMGVIIQEELKTEIGGVMVTTNPMNPTDFRNIYINVSAKSVVNVVQGAELPFQYLYNTVEGGGRTLSLGDAKEDLPDDKLKMLQNLAIIGRLLQAHFSKDYTFSTPMDIEWVLPHVDPERGVHDKHKFSIVQLRPYNK